MACTSMAVGDRGTRFRDCSQFGGAIISPYIEKAPWNPWECSSGTTVLGSYMEAEPSTLTIQGTYQGV